MQPDNRIVFYIIKNIYFIKIKYTQQIENDDDNNKILSTNNTSRYLYNILFSTQINSKINLPIVKMTHFCVITYKF